MRQIIGHSYLRRVEFQLQRYSDQRFPALSITAPLHMSMVFVQKEKKSLAIVQKPETGRHRYNAVNFLGMLIIYVGCIL